MKYSRKYFVFMFIDNRFQSTEASDRAETQSVLYQLETVTCTSVPCQIRCEPVALILDSHIFTGERTVYRLYTHT